MAATRYHKTESLLTRRVAGEAIVVPIRGRLADLRQIYTLNPVAEFVWGLLDEGRDLDELCRAVCGEFEVDEPQARADVREFVDALEAAGLVQGA